MERNENYKYRLLDHTYMLKIKKVNKYAFTVKRNHIINLS